ncbi:MAG: hypothetical protein WDO18_02980 [Acidobacteriota bacterium]
MVTMALTVDMRETAMRAAKMLAPVGPNKCSAANDPMAGTFFISLSGTA